MDVIINWSPEALEDVESIVEYISRDSEFYARAVVSKIIEFSRILKGFPLIGRVVPELNQENIRECMIYNYRLIYRYEKQTVLVVAVIHGARSLGSLTERLRDKM